MLQPIRHRVTAIRARSLPVTHPVTRRSGMVGHMNHDTNASNRLQTHLDQIAQRLIELGTSAETHRLAEIARAIQDIAPGAAAALVDWNGSEISRLRAFAVACSTVLRLLDADQANLVDGFERASTHLAAA